MPCYSQQTSVVQFGPQTDAALLAKALVGLGYTVAVEQQSLVFSRGAERGVYDGTKLTLSASGQVDMNVFKRAYSAEVVKAAGQRFGWGVKQTAPNAFQVTRRY